jgi:hypothetical protein
MLLGTAPGGATQTTTGEASKQTSRQPIKPHSISDLRIPGTLNFVSTDTQATVILEFSFL